ncbi:DUF6493 family protein [Streptosporangium minutum]|uniref:Secreted protein n=1 Tax=Streptosporangium minutum TaxID=569862 RepID=A0A2C9ZMR2_9ACTN|nr:DUF6493 family protein [Streptosporangium minutum]OUC90131.1 hypothetical protein CA984_36525 [Streptosporangium minutum]
MTVWDEVRDLIDDCDIDKLAARLIGLDDAGRQEVARELPGHLKLLRQEPPAPSPWAGGDRGSRGDWASRGDWTEPMRLAGAGSLGAAAVAAWLNRRDLALLEWEEPGDTEALIAVISAREPQWQADLVTRLALRVRTPNSPGASLVLTLLRRTGVTPPQHDPLVTAWVAVPPRASALRGDPLLDTLLPRIFEAQGVGRALREERSSPLSATSWLGALAVLGSEGRVSRETLLDGCVSRFLRGGDAQDLRFFARLHELLEPTYVEVESRARDYLRLLPVAPGPVAELSLAHLRRLDRLDPADVTEALEGLLFRAEAGLVRAGLTWLDQVVRQAPERADELVPALASALGHQAYAVQERAVRLAVKHARHLGPLGAETLREALAALPPDLGGRLAAAVGGEASPQEEPEDFTPPELAAPEPPGPFPALPASAAGFAGERWTHTWQSGERWLAGFVRFAATDREALRAALSGMARRASGLYDREEWYAPQDWFTAMAGELVSPGADPGPPDRWDPDRWLFVRDQSVRSEASGEDGGEPFLGHLPAEVREHVIRFIAAGDGDTGDAPRAGAGHPGARLSRGIMSLSEAHDRAGADHAVGSGRFGHAPAGPRRPARRARPDRLPEEGTVSRPHRFLLRRYAEVLAALKADALPPLLLATPTAATGHLDPAEFVSRLEAVEAAGAEPLPADFQQALLRLPGTVAPEVVARAGRLTSEAGRRAARRLKDGPAELETGVIWRSPEDPRDRSFDGFQTRMIPRLRAEPTGLAHIDELLGGVPAERWGEHGGHLDWWPAVLPSHRDAVAAHYLPHLPHSWSRPEVSPAHVETLAAGEGPAGEPTALLLAFFLARQDPSEGVRLLLRMAAAGDLPADALGRQLALLTARTEARLPHATAGLEAAARQGAHREVWAVIRAALPHLLPSAGQRPGPGVNDLVTLGTTVARWAGARGELPELVPFVSRRSSSAFTRECRRLHELLARP